jgi:hypothetical protein
MRTSTTPPPQGAPRSGLATLGLFGAGALLSFVACLATRQQQMRWPEEARAAFATSVADATSAVAVEASVRKSVADERPTVEGPGLVLDSALHDWGSIQAGEPVRHTFVIHNNGDRTTRLRLPRRLRRNVTIEFEKQIEPGAAGTVTVVLDTSNLQPGTSQVLVELDNNASRPLLFVLRGGVRTASD